MCIICEIKSKLVVSGANAEERKFITQRVEMLAAVASHCHDVVCDVLDGKPQNRAKLEETRVLGAVAFNDAPDALEQREAMLAEADTHEEVISDISEALAELFGGIKGASVRVHHVAVGDDESIADAIKRTLEGDQPTKH